MAACAAAILSASGVDPLQPGTFGDGLQVSQRQHEGRCGHHRTRLRIRRRCGHRRSGSGHVGVTGAQRRFDQRDLLRHHGGGRRMRLGAFGAGRVSGFAARRRPLRPSRSSRSRRPRRLRRRPPRGQRLRWRRRRRRPGCRWRGSVGGGVHRRFGSGFGASFGGAVSPSALTRPRPPRRRRRPRPSRSSPAPSAVGSMASAWVSTKAGGASCAAASAGSSRAVALSLTSAVGARSWRGRRSPRSPRSPRSDHALAAFSHGRHAFGRYRLRADVSASSFRAGIRASRRAPVRSLRSPWRHTAFGRSPRAGRVGLRGPRRAWRRRGGSHRAFHLVRHRGHGGFRDRHVHHRSLHAWACRGWSLLGAGLASMAAARCHPSQPIRRLNRPLGAGAGRLPWRLGRARPRAQPPPGPVRGGHRRGLLGQDAP